MNNLYYSYDHESDVLYLSRGKPSASDISEESSDDIVIRKNPKTKQVRGLTILNASKRTHGGAKPIRLPLAIEFTTT